MSAAAVSSARPLEAGAAKTTRSTRPGAPCAPGPTRSPMPRQHLPRQRASKTCSPTTNHAPLKATWCIYQRLIQAYRAADRGLGRFLMDQAITSLTQPVPAGLEEVAVPN